MSCTNVLEVCPAGSFLSKCEKKITTFYFSIENRFLPYISLFVCLCVCVWYAYRNNTYLITKLYLLLEVLSL